MNVTTSAVNETLAMRFWSVYFAIPLGITLIDVPENISAVGVSPSGVETLTQIYKYESPVVADTVAAAPVMSPHSITVSGPSSMSPGVMDMSRVVPVAFHAKSVDPEPLDPGERRIPFSLWIT